MAQLPQTGISTGLVGNTIGLGIDDIGLLCSDLQVEKVGEIWQAKVPHIRANRINKWSKWKPINTSIISLTDAVLKAANYGLNIPTVNWTQIRAYALNNLDIGNPSTQIKWEYNPPTGGEFSPYNLGAYRGYQKDSKSLFNTNIQQTKIVTLDGLGQCIWHLDLSQGQESGGLIGSDFNGAEYWNIGVMFIDYEADGNPITILKVNQQNILNSNEISVDITNLNSSTYIVCFFLASDELGEGVAQLNNPSTSQIESINMLYYLHPLEDGMAGTGVINRYVFPFVMWAFVGTGLLEEPFASSDNYRLSYYYNYTPLIRTTPSRMIWDETNRFFTIEPLFTPTAGFKWILDISMYKDNVDWTDNIYRGIVSWRDADGETVYLQMKTISGVMWFRYYNVANDVVIQEYNSTLLLSTNIDNDTVIRLSNFNGANALLTLSINGNVTTLSNSGANSGENPPFFWFGSDLVDITAPVGLGYKYIDLRAVGTF